MPNKTLLKQKFYQLSKQFHPDFYTNQSAYEQHEILEKSSLINKAFKVLNNTDETIEYILQEKNLITDDEKYNLPNSFLMEVMELNELLMEAKISNDATALQQIKQQINTLQTTLQLAVQQFLQAENIDTLTNQNLLEVKDYFYKKKYLGRILVQLT